MRILVDRVEVLVRQVLEEARKTADVPAVHRILGRIPGGQIVRSMIGHPASPSLKADLMSDTYTPPRVSVACLVVSTVEPVRTDPVPFEKSNRRAGTSRPAKPPVPVGTRVRMLTGAFTGWTGTLQWSPAKGAYNVRLTGPNGQQSRTTLSPSRLGSSWEVSSDAMPTGRGAKRERQEARP